MTLYYYTPITQPTNVAWSKSLSTVQGEGVARSHRTGARSQPAGAQSPQTVNPGGMGGASPFSADFSPDFGAGPAGFLISRAFGLGGAAVAHLVTPAKGTGHSPAEHVASAQAVARKTGLGKRAAAKSPSFVRAPSLARPNYKILPTTSNTVRGLVKTIRRTLTVWTGDPWSSSWSKAFGPGGLAVALVQVKAANVGAPAGSLTTELPSLLYTGVRQLVSTLHASVADHVAPSGLSLPTFDGSLAGLTRLRGKSVQATDAEAVLLNRTRPRSAGAAGTNTAGIGLQQLLQRTLAVAVVSVIATARSMATAYGAVSTDIAAAQHPLNKSLAASQAGAQQLTRLLSRLLQTTSGNLASGIRQFVLVRQIAVAAVVAMGLAAARRFATFSAQVAGLLPPSTGLGRSQPAAVLSPGVVAPVIISTDRLIPRAVAATQAQAFALAHGVQRLSAVASGSLPALVSGVGTRLAGVVAPRQVAGAVGIALARAATSLYAAFTRPSLSRKITVAMPMVVAIARSRNRLLPTITTQVAAGQTLSIRLLAAAGAQAVALGVVLGKIPALVSTSLAGLAFGRHMTMPTLSADSAAADLGKLFLRFASVAADDIAALGKLVSNRQPVAMVQVLSYGRALFRSFGTVTPSVARAIQPFGIILTTFQAQVGYVKGWRFPYIAPWAWQQIVTLPMAGGPPEPPSFGPFDPADQTLVGFDWSQRATSGDPLISASVVSVPPGMTFTGPVLVQGTLVQVMVAPFRPPQLPATYSLRCRAVFASGRVSSFTVPFPIRSL